MYFLYNSLDGQNGGQQQSGVNPAWCDGAFPTDLEDVTLSPTNNVNKQLTSASSAAAGSAAAGSGFEPTTSSSCSPPSVTDLTNLNPDSKYFDPDFDVVDDMKFIDSLIRTMPEDQQQQPHSSEHLVNSYQTSSNKRYIFLIFSNAGHKTILGPKAQGWFCVQVGL